VADLAVQPNKRELSASNFINCICRSGKVLGAVLILIPGNSTSPDKFFRFAACFIIAIRHGIADFYFRISCAPDRISFTHPPRSR